jgi:hypothetical protein
VPVFAWPNPRHRAGAKSPAGAADAALLLRRGAVAVAAGRAALGVVALAWPVVPARPWVGAAGDDLAVRVFGRALGARDLALGVGALAALRRSAGGQRCASGWVAAGALSDAVDVAVSVRAWRELPRRGRWLVAASAGGAALIGVAGAWAVRSAPDARQAEVIPRRGPTSLWLRTPAGL